MPPSIRNIFIPTFRPFPILSILTFIITVLTAPWSAQAHNNPTFTINPDTPLPDQLQGYTLFTVDSTADWAYLTFVQWADGQIKAFQIALAEYNEAESSWQIYAEGTADYMEALHRLPDWLTWLAQLEAQRDRTAPASLSGTYSLPGLPWKPDLAWRYNQGPLTADHLDAFDFGVPVNGVQDDIYFAEDGVVIGINGTCIIVERPTDGLRHFYQHIEPGDIFQFTFGEPVTYKQKIGRTTLISGCGGTTTGHHLHFAFYTPFGGPVMNPQGFIMNGWQVVGNNLVKGDEIAAPNYTDTVLHDATVFHDDFSQDNLSPEWFWIRENETNWSLVERPDFLRINTQPGTLDTTNPLPENLLLRAAMPSNYEVIVRFEAELTENYQEASLLLYQDDDNYLSISRLFDDINYSGDIYVVSQKEKGETAEPIFIADATEPITELRLIVTDRFVMAFYLNENGDWKALGLLDINGLELYPFIGLSAYLGTTKEPAASILVDFDFTQAQPIETDQIYLPITTHSYP